MDEEKSFLARYTESRRIARLHAEHEFLTQHSDLLPLIASSGEYLSSCILNLSGKNFRANQHGLYASDLIISFTRTHFIALDLLFQGELIEAAVLARKQFEVLARLHELAANDKIDNLVGKTPNVKNLTTKLRRCYSAYSELAHSAKPIHLQQLGRIEAHGQQWTPVYPTYCEQATTTFQHILLSLAEFHSWASLYLEKIFSLAEFSTFESNFLEFATEYVAVYGENNIHDE
jgi:hypothetical protein